MFDYIFDTYGLYDTQIFPSAICPKCRSDAIVINDYAYEMECKSCKNLFDLPNLKTKRR